MFNLLEIEICVWSKQNKLSVHSALIAERKPHSLLRVRNIVFFWEYSDAIKWE